MDPPALSRTLQVVKGAITALLFVMGDSQWMEAQEKWLKDLAGRDYVASALHHFVSRTMQHILPAVLFVSLVLVLFAEHVVRVGSLPLEYQRWKSRKRIREERLLQREMEAIEEYGTFAL